MFRTPNVCDPVDVVRLADSFGAKGMMIRQPEEVATTLKRALEMAGPVVVAIPVDYRDNHRLLASVHPGVLNCRRDVRVRNSTTSGP
jgi:acetolactate synthase I/II/III large subunit